MAAPIGPQTSSDPNAPIPSTIDLRAPAAPFDEIASRFGAILEREDAVLRGEPIPTEPQPPRISPAAVSGTPVPPRIGPAVQAPHIPEEPVVGVAPPAIPPVPVEPTEPVAPVPEPEPVLPDGSPEAESAVSAEEDGSIRSVAQLAAFHNVEEDVLREAIHITTADGNEISLATVIDGYLAQPEAALAAEERIGLEGEFVTRRTELESIHDEALLRTGHMAKVMYDDMMGTMPSAEEMARLKSDEPEIYAERRLQQVERQQSFQRAMGHLEEEYAQRTTAHDASEAQWQKDEAQKIVKIFPDLANPATQKQQDSAIKSYLGGLGFKAAEMASLYDSRMYRVVRDAMYGSQLRKTGAAKLAAARDKGLPTPKPGPSARVDAPSQTQQNAQRLDAARQRATRTGTVDDAAALFREMGVA